ncbi:unnamed protein product, partial [Adineta ricciae]
TNSANQIVFLNNIGKALYRLKQIDEAEKYFEEALQLTKKIFSSSADHINLAYTYKNQGEILLAKNNFVGALALFQQAHDMYKRIFVQNSNQRDVAKCQYLIGLSHLSLNDIEQATTALEQALHMRTNALHPDHPDLAFSHRSMGDLYMCKKNEVKAIEHFKLALAIWEKRLPSDHDQLVDLKDILAHFKP